jgi:hypothetical protein
MYIKRCDVIRKDCRSVLAACGPSSVNTKSLMRQSGELRQTLISIIAQVYIFLVHNVHGPSADVLYFYWASAQAAFTYIAAIT